MKNINNKLILLSQITLATLAIFAFSLFVMPSSANAYATYTVPNPSPSIDSITPNASNSGEAIRSIMINGSGFAPSSVAKINGSNRVTTFIDDSHLMMQVNPGDTYRTDGGFYVTVWTSAPGGGFSNASFFNVSNVATPPATYSNNYPNYPQNNSYYTYPPNVNSGYNNYQNTYPPATTTQTYNTPPQATIVPPADSGKSLASVAIFGSNTFLPSGLTQWVLFGIIILLIVILVRKVFGATDRYHAVPLKHD
jgi:hypothetical protein